VICHVKVYFIRWGALEIIVARVWLSVNMCDYSKVMRRFLKKFCGVKDQESKLW